jgi:hypothetical protein
MIDRSHRLHTRDWSLDEAVRRYGNRIVWNEDCFPLVEDARGVCHTDETLRAVGAMLMPDSLSQTAQTHPHSQSLDWPVARK